MKSTATTPEEYIAQLPDDRKVPIQKLRQIILDHLDPGFYECINYGMLAQRTLASPAHHSRPHLAPPRIFPRLRHLRHPRNLVPPGRPPACIHQPQERDQPQEAPLQSNPFPP